MVKEINFKVTTDKPKYLLGEPVIAYTEIHNSGTEALSVIDQLDPKFEIVKFYIKNEKSQESNFRPVVVADSIEHRILLEPGKSVKPHASKIFYGRNGWTFGAAGRYELRASYKGIADNPQNEPEIFDSNIVVIDIASPRSHDEEEQVNLMMGREQGLFLLFESGDHLSDGITALSDIVKKFPQSDLAGYANVALGKSYSRDFKDLKKGTVRKADLGKTISHLENAKDKDVGSYFRGEAYLTLLDAYDRSGNPVAAKRILSEFVKTSSNDSKQSENLRKAQNMLQ